MSEEDFYRWLGRYLKEIRKRKRLTQFDICNSFKLSRSSLSNVEAGRHHLSIYHLYQLLYILEKPFGQFLDSIQEQINQNRV